MTNLALWVPDLTELDRLAIAFAVRRKGKLTRFDSLDAAASPSEILFLCRGFVIVALFRRDLTTWFRNPRELDVWA